MLERARGLAFGFLGRFADELPVLVVLGSASTTHSALPQIGVHGALECGRRATAGVRRAETTVGDFAHDNPLAVGAAALAAGVGVGLLIPSTSKEDELLGDARDRLVSDVRGSAEELGRAVKDTAQEISTALR